MINGAAPPLPSLYVFKDDVFNTKKGFVYVSIWHSDNREEPIIITKYYTNKQGYHKFQAEQDCRPEAERIHNE
jgi:hypothetical protein